MAELRATETLDLDADGTITATEDIIADGDIIGVNVSVGADDASAARHIVNVGTTGLAALEFQRAGVKRRNIEYDASTGALAIKSYDSSGVLEGTRMQFDSAGIATFYNEIVIEKNGNSILTVGSPTTGTNGIYVRGAAGTNRTLRYYSGTSLRWQMGASTTAESGSNAGSPFRISAFDDAGSFIDIPLEITRASGGAITFARPTVNSNGSHTVGVSGTTRGVMYATRGTSTNTPGVLRLQSKGGTDYYLWVTDAGQLRYHTSLPTADTDGSAV